MLLVGMFELGRIDKGMAGTYEGKEEGEEEEDSNGGSQ